MPSYPRHPSALAQQAATVNALCGGRLVLGVGPSHAPGIEALGLAYDRPSLHMREYVSVLKALGEEGRVDFQGDMYQVRTGFACPEAAPFTVVISALAPLMLRAAGEVADGTVTWMVGKNTIAASTAPRITAAAAKAGRDAPRVIVGLPVCVHDDKAQATARAVQIFQGYGQLPNYRRQLDAEGIDQARRDRRGWQRGRGDRGAPSVLRRWGDRSDRERLSSRRRQPRLVRSHQRVAEIACRGRLNRRVVEGSFMNARISWLLAAVLVAGCSETPTPTEDDAASLPPGVAFVDAVERKPDAQGSSVVIPYRRFRLDNGLTVILHRDTSDPLVHVDVTYHVGSAREDIGKSGFAHFFEHMMFQGSENVGDEQHFKIVSESRRHVEWHHEHGPHQLFQTAPSNQLEKLLWLEADRLGFLLDAVTQEKFEVQRDTVKNERAQVVDNVPYGLLNERVGEAMYPEGHPYSWLTIGYVEDLDRGRRQRLEAILPALVRAQQRGVDHRRRFRRGRRPWLGWPSTSALFHGDRTWPSRTSRRSSWTRAATSPSKTTSRYHCCSSAVLPSTCTTRTKRRLTC